MQEFDHYQILGISRHATAQEVRAGYLKMVKKTHPDANPTGSSTELFQKVQRAYEVLSDPDKRKVYDSFLNRGSAQSGQYRESNSSYQSSYQYEQSSPPKDSAEPKQRRRSAGFNKKFAAAAAVGLFALAAFLFITTPWVSDEEVITPPPPAPVEPEPPDEPVAAPPPPVVVETHTEITYARWRDRTSFIQIYTRDPENSDEMLLSNSTRDDIEPDWSPDGSKIAFVSRRQGDPFEIFVMNADGSGRRQLTFTNYDKFSPVWSPDGSKIAFRARSEGYDNIFVINADGSGETQLTFGEYTEQSPTWSPDGSKIAFESIRSNSTAEIAVMNADGSDIAELTANNYSELTPAWSPDGSKIAYVSWRDGPAGDIFVMDPDGSNQTQLTFDEGVDVNPAWSPDSSRIAFESRRDGDAEIFVMDADGSNLTQLTENEFDDGSPSWSPLIVVERPVLVTAPPDTTLPEPPVTPDPNPPMPPVVVTPPPDPPVTVTPPPDRATDRQPDIIVNYAIVDELNPSRISYRDLVDEAFTKWEELNPNIGFREVGNNSRALDLLFIFEDIHERQDYIGLYCASGCDSYTDYAEILIDVGENACNPNAWQLPARLFSPFVYRSLLDTTMHEIGHHLGLDHHTDENHLLYGHGDSEALGYSDYDTLGYVIPPIQIQPGEPRSEALAELERQIENLDDQLAVYDDYDLIPSHLYAHYSSLYDARINLTRYWNTACLN